MQFFASSHLSFMAIQNTTLDDVSAVIGFTATLHLAAWFGNSSNLYVPEQAEEGQLLVRLIGMSAAQQLAAAFPQATLALPKLTTYDEAVVRRRICRMLEAGMTTREVGRFEGLSERRVQQVCRELEAQGLLEPVGPARPKILRNPALALQAALGAGMPVGKAAGKSPRRKTGGKKA